MHQTFANEKKQLGEIRGNFHRLWIASATLGRLNETFTDPAKRIGETFENVRQAQENPAPDLIDLIGFLCLGYLEFVSLIGLVTENGKTRRIPALEVMLRRLANDAMRSDPMP